MPYAKGEVMNITVYLGASKGNDNTLANAVRELGTWIEKVEIRLFTEALNPG